MIRESWTLLLVIPRWGFRNSTKVEVGLHIRNAEGDKMYSQHGRHRAQSDIGLAVGPRELSGSLTATRGPDKKSAVSNV